MTTTAPPRPPQPRDPLADDDPEALIEEARRRARRRRIMYAAGAVLALVGFSLITLIGRGESPRSAVANERSGRPIAADAGTVEVDLAEWNGSGQSGTATLEPNDDGTLNVTVELSGDQDEPQPAHIHEGSCPADPDSDGDESSVAMLNEVDGGTSTTENIEFSLDLASADSPGYAIDVHHSHLFATLVACGDVTDVSLP